MAIFTSHNKGTKITTAYFSPQAASLAMQFGADSCESDFVDVALSLLVGDESSIDYLFPEAEAR
jgi:predicted HD phosphohydrolase